MRYAYNPRKPTVTSTREKRPPPAELRRDWSIAANPANPPPTVTVISVKRNHVFIKAPT
jgi:hypothetical protein